MTISKEITGKTLQFDSIRDLQKWVEQEQEAYQWLSQIRRNFSNNLLSHVNAQFQLIHQQMSAINQSISRTQPFDGHLNAIESWFASTYSKKKLILSISSEFKAVMDLKESSPVKAAVFLGHALSIPNLYQHGIETIEML